MKNPPLEEGRLEEERGQKGNQSDSLLSGMNPGKKELLIGKQLHERIEEMFRSGRKKKEFRLLGVDIKTVRKITKGEAWKPYVRTMKREGVLCPWKEWVRSAPRVSLLRVDKYNRPWKENP